MGMGSKKKKPVLLAAADAAVKKKDEGKWNVKVQEAKNILDDTISVVSNTAKDTITTLLDDDLDEEDFYSDDESMISREDDVSVISTSSRNSNKSARDRIAQARPVQVEKKEDRKQQQKNKRNNGKFKKMKKGRRRLRFFGQRSKKNRNKETRRVLETTADETQFEDDTIWIDRIADKFGCLCGIDDAYSYDDDTDSFDSYGSEERNFIA